MFSGFADLPEYQPFSDLEDFTEAAQNQVAQDRWGTSDYSGEQFPARVSQYDEHARIAELSTQPKYVDRRVREDIGATLAEPTTFLIAREVLWPRT